MRLILDWNNQNSLTHTRCPVCNQNLDEFGSAEEQEFHVRACLEGGSGTPQAAKYLVYNLPAGSALLGEECTARFSHGLLPANIPLGVICLEEFIKGNESLLSQEWSSIIPLGSTVARLSCFCSFHNSRSIHYPISIS